MSRSAPPFSYGRVFQALGRAEDEEDTLAASLVKAEQVADLAEFNENVPLEPEEEEQNRVEQEISALVEKVMCVQSYHDV